MQEMKKALFLEKEKKLFKYSISRIEYLMNIKWILNDILCDKKLDFNIKIKIFDVSMDQHALNEDRTRTESLII